MLGCIAKVMSKVFKWFVECDVQVIYRWCVVKVWVMNLLLQCVFYIQMVNIFWNAIIIHTKQGSAYGIQFWGKGYERIQTWNIPFLNVSLVCQRKSPMKTIVDICSVSFLVSKKLLNAALPCLSAPRFVPWWYDALLATGFSWFVSPHEYTNGTPPHGCWCASSSKVVDSLPVLFALLLSSFNIVALLGTSLNSSSTTAGVGRHNSSFLCIAHAQSIRPIILCLSINLQFNLLVDSLKCFSLFELVVLTFAVPLIAFLPTGMDIHLQWVLLLTRVATHPRGADTKSAVLLPVIVFTMLCIVSMTNVFPAPGRPLIYTVCIGGRGRSTIFPCLYRYNCLCQYRWWYMTLQTENYCSSPLHSSVREDYRRYRFL